MNAAQLPCVKSSTEPSERLVKCAPNPWYDASENKACMVLTCPKNRKNRGLLRSSDVWVSYDPSEHSIPDGRRFLRRDRKNRKHFYFEGPSQTFPDVGNFYDECEHEICLSGTSGMFLSVFSCYQSLISSELSIINV